MANPPITLPDPKKQPLLALKTILHIYLPLGGPAWLSAPAGFSPLANVVLYIIYFIAESYVSTMLCFLLLGFLLMIDRQISRKKRAYGGRLFANPFTEADLEQRPADRDALERMTTDALYQRFGDELRLLIRLLRAAQLAFRLAPDGKDWLPRHRAAVVVLLRIAQISAVLRHRGSRFLAEECLRWQARRVWWELFGGAQPPESPLTRRLQPMTMKPWGPFSITIHLLREQAAGHPIPAPFVERFPRWAEQLRSGQRVG
jgi:hypothetical protein